MGLFFEFERNKDSFLLMGTDKDFKVSIKKADMLVRKCQINDSVKLAHRKALEIGDIKYPIKQNKTYVSIIDNGTKEHTITSLGTPSSSTSYDVEIISGTTTATSNRRL